MKNGPYQSVNTNIHIMRFREALGAVLALFPMTDTRVDFWLVSTTEVAHRRRLERPAVTLPLVPEQAEEGA